jgi:hypothetical protein
MRKKTFPLVLTAILCISAVTAQRSAEKYLISATAGGVNFISGEVSRVGPQTGHLLKGDSIRVGESVLTGENGRVEVLMNPGSFIRVGPNSEFSFESVALDDLRATLKRGSAIFEVYATDRFQVIVTTPSGALTIADSGVYRFDLDQSGMGSFSVLKGKAKIAGRTDVIKEGREVQLGSTAVAVKFDKKLKADELSMWSRDRSKELAKISSSLSGSALNSTLLSSFASGRFGLWDSFGVWVSDASRSGFCFLPFGFGWRSPYGFGVNTGIDWWQLQRLTYNPMYFPRGYPRSPGNMPAGNNMSPGTVAVSPPVAPGGGETPTDPAPIRPHPRMDPPPFAEIQRQQKVDPAFTPGEDGFRRGRSDVGTRAIDGPSAPFGGSSPSGMSSSPAAAPMSAPAIAPAHGRTGKVSPIDD